MSKRQGGKPRATRWYICTNPSCEDIYHRGGGYVPLNRPKSKTDPALIRRRCAACPKRIPANKSNIDKQIEKKARKAAKGWVRLDMWVREKDRDEAKALERASQALDRRRLPLIHYHSQP